MGARCHASPCLALIAVSEFSTPAVRALVHSLKYRRRRAVAETVAELLAASLIPALSALGLSGVPFVLIPIPLARARERERGFNQARMLAEALARILPQTLRVDAGALARIKETPSQTSLSGRAPRIRNVAGCFAARPGRPPKETDALLLDDVATSGATLAEAALTLQRAGYRRVVALVFAAA
jgi:ComF family protein